MKTNSIEDVYELKIPKIVSPEGMGALSFVENEIIPFPIKRVYLLIDDGFNSKKITLNSPNIGFFLPKGICREMNNFSKDSVCLVLASENYDEKDYIRNYKDFKKSI